MGRGSSHFNYTRKISQNDDCENLNFVTELMNIQPAIKDYKKDDLLNIVLGPVNTVNVEGDFGILGYITSAEIHDLIDCLGKGKKFNAVITDIGFFNCRVRIFAA